MKKFFLLVMPLFILAVSLAPAAATAESRGRNNFANRSDWGNYGHSYDRGSHRHYYGGNGNLAAGIFLGALGYGVADRFIEAIVDSQRPIVMYQAPAPVQPTYVPQPAYATAPPTPDVRYPTSPECAKYIGYPEYLAACEQGVAEKRADEHRQEEQRRAEQRARCMQEAYETGRGSLPRR